MTDEKVFITQSQYFINVLFDRIKISTNKKRDTL